MTHNARILKFKLRNPEAVIVTRYYRPKIYKAKKHDLRAADQKQQVNDYMRGLD